MILNSEKLFFQRIKDDCDIIFDVGAADDIFYAENCSGKEIHFFEPYPGLFYRLEDELGKTITYNRIFLNNFGLGKRDETLKYYVQASSFFPRDEPVSPDILELRVCSIHNYILLNNIKKIDFLKIDTEGYETDILLDDVMFIKENIKYIQFEWGGKLWKERRSGIFLDDIFHIFEDEFNFGYLYDVPILRSEHEDKLSFLNNISDYEDKGRGINFIMIKKGIAYGADNISNVMLQ